MTDKFSQSAIDAITAKYQIFDNLPIRPSQEDKDTLLELLEENVGKSITEIANEPLDFGHLELRYGKMSAHHTYSMIRDLVIYRNGNPDHKFPDRSTPSWKATPKNSGVLELYHEHVLTNPFPVHPPHFTRGFGAATAVKVEQYLFEKGMVPDIPYVSHMANLGKINSVYARSPIATPVTTFNA